LIGMPREIVLDTETTGLDPKRGHRVVEIACVELEDFLPTGRHFHCYVDPQRDIDPEAGRVHGLSRDFLSDKPTFAHATVGEAFLAFVAGDALIAHNAAFDRAFINHELGLAGRPVLPEERWVDTLGLAQKRFPGMYNSLDALCKRFKISLAEREKHGALIDAKLLASVYLELRGGRERRLDLAQSASNGVAQVIAQATYGARPRALPSRLTDAERAAHQAFVRGELKGSSLWARFEG
jgi:DNA polymerase-3 subunit epsilon